MKVNLDPRFTTSKLSEIMKGVIKEMDKHVHQGQV